MALDGRHARARISCGTSEPPNTLRIVRSLTRPEGLRRPRGRNVGHDMNYTRAAQLSDVSSRACTTTQAPRALPADRPACDPVHAHRPVYSDPIRAHRPLYRVASWRSAGSARGGLRCRADARRDVAQLTCYTLVVHVQHFVHEGGASLLGG